MSARRKRSNVTRGVITVSLLMASFAALFLGPRADALTEDHVALYADFRNLSRLRQGSLVQLAVVDIGRVEAVDFVQVRYACDPLSEDIGRYGQGRTNSCDQDLFCSPQGFCAELDEYAGKGFHTRCDDTYDCAQDEVCFTGDLRYREAHLLWGGPRGVCARYDIDHTRSRIRMRVPLDVVSLIRSDSRVVVASNGVLEAPKVNISAGQGDELCPLVREDLASYSYERCLQNMRVQARPSLGEDIDRLRHRVESFMEKADTSIVAVIGFIEQLQSEETMDGLKGTVHNLSVITHTLAYGDGLVPALMHSQEFRKDIGTTLGALHSTSFGLQRAAGHANDVLDALDRNAEPLLDDTEATLERVNGLLADLDDPKNKSLGAKFLRDDAGDIARDLELIFDHGADLSGDVASISAAIDDGKGTLGLLAKDGRVAQDLGHLLSFFSDRPTWRAILLWRLEKMGAINSPDASRSSARP